MKMPKIPAIYQEIEQLILIPSYSIAKNFIKELTNRQIELKTAPLFADCYQPRYFETGSAKNILVSQFIGATGAIYLINLLREFKLRRVFFLGSAGFYSENSELNLVPDFNVCFPTKYLPCIEESSEQYSLERIPLHVQNILRNRDTNFALNREEVVSSTNKPTYLNPELVNKIWQSKNIHIYDMEAAFIAQEVNKLGISFGCALFITDHDNRNSLSGNSIKIAGKSPKFQEVLDYVLSFL